MLGNVCDARDSPGQWLILCQVDASFLYPDCIFLGVSVRTFRMKSAFELVDSVKQMHPPQYGWASSNPQRALVEQQEKNGGIYSPSPISLLELGHLLPLSPVLTLTLTSSDPLAPRPTDLS